MATPVLERYGEFAAKNPAIVIAITAIVTLILAVQAAQLRIDTDFEGSLPQHLESIRNQHLLEDAFHEPERFFVLVRLNTDDTFHQRVSDIRDAALLEKLYELETLLEGDPEITGVFGPSDLVVQSFGGIPADQQAINAVLADAGSLISRDYAFTFLSIDATINTDDESILGFVEAVEKDIESIGFPGSVVLSVTGPPLVQTTIFTLLLEDMVTTMALAGVIILLILIVGYRSPIKGSVAMTLLLLAVIWTGGTMQLLSIPLSVITVMVGAMIIGIGIDYTIHVMNRYAEERGKGKGKESSAGVAINRVGKAILGTSATTIVSFLSQAGSGVPFLTDMGIALSLGIFYAMMTALFVLPALIVAEERLSARIKEMIAP